MGIFNDRPTTNSKGRSIATPASKIKAERAARAQRDAQVARQKAEKGKGRTKRGDGF